MFALSWGELVSDYCFLFQLLPKYYNQFKLILRFISGIHVISYECWIKDNLLNEVPLLLFDIKLLVIEVRVVEPVVDTFWTRKPRNKIYQNKLNKNNKLFKLSISFFSCKITTKFPIQSPNRIIVRIDININNLRLNFNSSLFDSIKTKNWNIVFYFFIFFYLIATT